MGFMKKAKRVGFGLKKKKKAKENVFSAKRAGKIITNRYAELDKIK